MLTDQTPDDIPFNENYDSFNLVDYYRIYFSKSELIDLHFSFPHKEARVCAGLALGYGKNPLENVSDDDLLNFYRNSSSKQLRIEAGITLRKSGWIIGLREAFLHPLDLFSCY